VRGLRDQELAVSWKDIAKREQSLKKRALHAEVRMAGFFVS